MYGWTVAKETTASIIDYIVLKKGFRQRNIEKE